METFGTYRLTYTPGVGDGIEPTVGMSISGEANLSEMLSFFDSFLKAAGYVYEGDLTIKGKSQSNPKFDVWEDDGSSIVGNPWMATYGNHLPGGNDHLFFVPGFGSNVVTFS